MNVKSWGAMLVAATVAGGCGEADRQAGTTPADTAHSPDAAYVLAAEPSGSLGVGEARRLADEEVTVVGRIGGSAKPFVDGLAAFTIVDPSIPYCADEEGCPTPWDYCCTQNEVKDNIATVEIVDDQGQTVAKDAKALLGVKELSTVVVQGKARRDEQGNLTVLASKVFVKK
ncbi:MAG: hypothetical protein WD066_03585 [Planctomycetaceae bacterium]